MLFASLCLSSTSVIAFATAVDPGESLWLKLLPAALVSILWAADHVLGNERKAWLHENFARRFTGLERRLVSPEGKSLAVVAEVYDKVLEIEADEPPILNVLNTLCRNELMRAEGFPQEQQIPVRFLPRLFSGFTDLGVQ